MFKERLLSGVLLVLAIFGAIYFGGYVLWGVLLLISLIGMFELNLFGIFYVAMMLCCIYRIRGLDGGVYLVWMVFLGAWGSDTCAYCVGKLMGKHKAFPVLSPKKSVEGCVGGVLGAALLAWVFALLFQDKLTAVGNPLIALPIIGACASILSQFGDLAASGIKRQHKIKDYGTLIPGHGGVLDRFDSVIVTAPAVYLLLVTFFV